MSDLDKKEKVLLILEKVKKDGITAYDLSKKLNLSESGLNKLFRGEIKNPHNSTVEALHNYLFNLKTTNVEHKLEIDGNLCKLSSISSAVMNNEKLFMENDKGFKLYIQDLVRKGVEQVLDENGIKISYTSEKK